MKNNFEVIGEHVGRIIARQWMQTYHAEEPDTKSVIDNNDKLAEPKAATEPHDKRSD